VQHETCLSRFGATKGLNAACRVRVCALPANTAELHLLALPHRPGGARLGLCAAGPASARVRLTSECGAAQYDEEAGHEAFADDFQQAMTYFTKLSLTGGEVPARDARLRLCLQPRAPARWAQCMSLVQERGRRCIKLLGLMHQCSLCNIRTFARCA